GVAAAADRGRRGRSAGHRQPGTEHHHRPPARLGAFGRGPQGSLRCADRAHRALTALSAPATGTAPASVIRRRLHTPSSGCAGGDGLLLPRAGTVSLRWARRRAPTARRATVGRAPRPAAGWRG